MAKPDGVGISVWLREDMFAGLMAKDYERVEMGLRKANQLLDKDPNQLQALNWSCVADLVLAVRDFEAQRSREFSARYDQAKRCFVRVQELAPKNSGVKATVGVTWSALAFRLPAQLQPEALDFAYGAWTEGLRQIRSSLKNKPQHNQGEYLLGAAQAAYRSGHIDEATQYLSEVQAMLPDTPFAVRAQKWMARQDLMRSANPSCQTCHEPGRLANVMAALEKK